MHSWLADGRCDFVPELHVFGSFLRRPDADVLHNSTFDDNFVRKASLYRPSHAVVDVENVQINVPFISNFDLFDDVAQLIYQSCHFLHFTFINCRGIDMARVDGQVGYIVIRFIGHI
jgi:hypothetical protein